MPNKFEEFAKKAAEMTDSEFKNEFSNLTSLTNNEILKVINETGISKEDLAKVLQAVKDATLSNEAKAKAIKNIDEGISALISIAKKIL